MKAEDEIEEILAQNMHYHQPSFIAGFKKGKESQLQALKEEVDKLPINDFNSDVEWVKLDHIRNLIVNLEDNG